MNSSTVCDKVRRHSECLSLDEHNYDHMYRGTVHIYAQALCTRVIVSTRCFHILPTVPNNYFLAVQPVINNCKETTQI